MHTTIISTEEASQHLDDPNWAFIDCRFQLDDTAAGRQAYLAGHIPRAVYAHLDEDLSGPVDPKNGGRHPLPAIEPFAETLSNWGITNETQVVAYDSMSGVYAGRLWWMLRWLGHDKVAVLDGDFRTWAKEGRPTSSGAESRPAAKFIPNPRSEMMLSVEEVEANVESRQYQLYDARDESRFRGESAGMDSRAGHIPGAKSAFFQHNLGEDGKFLPAEKLRERFTKLLDGQDPADTVWYCGSGVSVHHDLIAMEIAGFAPCSSEDGAKVYIGSWSDWSSSPDRPIATGD